MAKKPSEPTDRLAVFGKVLAEPADPAARRELRRQLKQAVNRELASYQRRFEQGDDMALLLAVETIVLFSSAPLWVKNNFIERFRAWLLYQPPALDAAFKVERPGKHAAEQRVREDLRSLIVYAVLERHKDGMSIDEACKAVAVELHGRRWKWVSTLFFEPASRPARKMFSALLGLPRPR